MATLPYVTSPGNIERALLGIKAASTPDRVTQDFVKTILKIPSGSGDQITSFLRKLGFANADGSPSEVYKKFRNGSTSSQAVMEALKIGYAPLYKRNEFMHAMADDELRGLVIEETGAGNDSSVPTLVVSCINGMRKFIKGDSSETQNSASVPTNLPAIANPAPELPKATGTRLGMNLSYTINLNLPATSDVAVFNAIFKSLRENLLREGNHE